MSVYLGVLLIALTAVVLSFYYVYKLSAPTPGNCSAMKEINPTYKWSDDCSYVQELQADPGIVSPTVPLFLSSFTSSPSLGAAWKGVNVWYRYRYVNIKTGGYGTLSPWTVSPISACSSTLPCKSGNCSGSFQYSGNDSCSSNLPELELDTLAYPVGGDYYINVHRISSADKTQPKDSDQGSVIGVMMQTSNASAKFIDVTSSPLL